MRSSDRIRMPRLHRQADGPAPRAAIIMKRLLVVDDALFMRKLICGVAAEAGWEVAGEAANGPRRLSSTSSSSPTW